MQVFVFDSADWDEAAEHGLTKEAATTAVSYGLEAAKKLLPNLSDHLNVVVRSHTLGIIPEYGVGGLTHDAEYIELRFDKSVPYGAQKTLESLRQTVFHESNHALRRQHIALAHNLVARAISEGLAVVFEREHANHNAPFGAYENDATMQQWFKEVQAAGDNWSKYDDLFFRNPDGRRWIGYKTGTWIIDQAIKKSGKTVIELTTLPADDIIKLAGL